MSIAEYHWELFYHISLKKKKTVLFGFILGTWAGKSQVLGT